MPFLAGLLLVGLDTPVVPLPRRLEVPLRIEAREAAARPQAVVTSGVPFPPGALRDPSLVRAFEGTAEIPMQARATAAWRDGSVRWLLVDLQTDLPAAPGAASVVLRTGAPRAAVAGVSVTDGASTLTVRTGAAAFAFDKSELLLLGSRFEAAAGGVVYQARPDVWAVEEQGPLRAVVRVEGRWVSAAGAAPGGADVRFRVRLSFRRGDGAALVTATFQNRGPFCWEREGCVPASPVVLSRASFGAVLLPAGGAYTLGPGAEKSWDLRFDPQRGATPAETRFAADGALSPGSVPLPPLALPSAAWVAATGAWGRVAPPVEGAPPARQADLDRFEKLQRAKVLEADVEDPPGREGTTIWRHLAPDLGSWNDYGDLRWAGNGCGSLSGNHYDWPYGMALQLLRTGRVAFADAARLLARHEEDLDVYHTAGDGAAYNFQKQWEDRPSHDSPDNCFGGGRPTHTWTQGYALHWLLTGDARGKDAFDELQEGVRQYLYESFNGAGHVSTSEIRTHGWLVENLVARYRVDPGALLQASEYGSRSIPEAIQEVLADLYEREAAAGGLGFTVSGEPWDPDYPHLRSGLQHLYVLEPLIEAYVEVFKGRDPVAAARLLGLVRRTTTWLLSVSYGGDTDASGRYRPRQVPYLFDARRPADGQGEGQVVYGLMLANALAFLHLEGGDAGALDAARALFSDYVRYAGVVPGDTRVDPSLRSAASYASSVFDGTESKIHGWSNRYGQWLLAAEGAAAHP